MCSRRAAATIAVASAAGQARTFPASRIGAGGMVPCSIQFLIESALRSSMAASRSTNVPGSRTAVRSRSRSGPVIGW